MIEHRIRYYSIILESGSRKVSSQFKIFPKLKKKEFKIREAERLVHKTPLMLNARWLNRRFCQILPIHYRKNPLQIRCPYVQKTILTLKDILVQAILKTINHLLTTRVGLSLFICNRQSENRRANGKRILW